jgi:hypothetical protein
VSVRFFSVPLHPAHNVLVLLSNVLKVQGFHSWTHQECTGIVIMSSILQTILIDRNDLLD